MYYYPFIHIYMYVVNAKRLIFSLKIAEKVANTYTEINTTMNVCKTIKNYQYFLLLAWCYHNE